MTVAAVSDAAPEARQLARRSARALGWSWAGALVRALLQLVAQIALARLLGPEAWGQAAAALLVLGVASLVAEWGLSSALIQRQELRPADAGLAAGWLALASTLVAAGVAALALPIAALFGGAPLVPLILAAAAIVPLQALALLPAALLQRRFRARALQGIQLAAYLVGYGCVGIGLALAGAGAWSLLAAFAAHALVTLAAGLAALPDVNWRPRLGPHEARRGLLGYGTRTMAANLVNWGIESVDRLLVGALQGSSALGVYSVAANLARAPVALLVSAAQPVAFAAAARLQDEHDRLVRGYLAMLSLALLAALPLFAALAWFAEPIVALLYGAAWVKAARPFAWLCAGVPFFVMLALTGPMLRGVDAVGSEMRAQAAVLAALVLALAFGLPLVEPAARLAAAAALVSGATALRAIALLHALARRVGLSAGAAWRCWRGGLLLTSLVLALAAVLQVSGLGANWQMALTAALAPLLLIMAVRLAGAWLIGPELALALRNRVGDLPMAAALVRWGRVG